MSRNSGDVVCPFYRYDDGARRIVCEGLTDRSSIVQRYKRKTEFRRQMEVFCCQHCDRCELFAVLLEKYAE